MYERSHVPPLPHRMFVWRVIRHVLWAFLLIIGSLLAGMWGYEHYESLAWRDAFLNSAMLLGGMGPVNPPQTPGGKVFAGLYALYAGLVFLIVAATVFAPMVHRLMHRFHWEQRER